MGSGFNSTLRYRLFDQLISDVMVDFRNYTLENLIDPQDLVKVARRINYDLGLRIYKTKEVLLELQNGKVRLPDDFFTANFAFLCGEETTEQILPQGTHIEDQPLFQSSVFPPYQEVPATVDLCAPAKICGSCQRNPCGCTPANPCSDAQYNPSQPYGDYCIKPRVYMNCKNQCFEVVQIVKTRKVTHRHITPIQFISDAQGIECGCPGLYVKSKHHAWIKDGWLYTNMDCGKVYLNYEGMLEDEEGNLLVPDHELLNEYYEYGCKLRILENLLYSDENVVTKLQFTEQRYREARKQAVSIVNTPNYAEMKELWEMNRKAQYQKYFLMFSGYPIYQYNSDPFYGNPSYHDR